MATLAERLVDDPVPPGGTDEFRNWRRRYEALKDEDLEAAATVFLRTLEHGDIAQQYSVLMGLRFIGYEAFAEGHERDLRYDVWSPTRDLHWVIAPKIATYEDQLAVWTARGDVP